MNAKRMPILAANWKLNQLWDDCEEFVNNLRNELPAFFEEDSEPGVELLICPTTPYLPLLGSLLDESVILIGAQDVSRFDKGAYTGDVAAAMLADVGCDFAIVGHSERRNVFGDTDGIVGEKLDRLREADVSPVLCIGESLETRKAGRAESFVREQLDAVHTSLAKLQCGGFAIAYEPIWAIGTGENARPEDVHEIAGVIRSWLDSRIAVEYANDTPILYGGSVKPDNIASYLGIEDIDGALIGGASLDAESYAAMVKVCLDLIKA